MSFVQKYGNSNKIYSPFIKKYSQYQTNIEKEIDNDDKDDLVTTLDLVSGEKFDPPSYKPEQKPTRVASTGKKSTYQRDYYKAKKLSSIHILSAI